MALEKDRIVILDEQGVEKAFYKLLQFTSTETNQRYLVYTDDKKDEEGQLNLYSSIIVEKDGKIEFIPVQEEKDQDIVNQAIIQMKLELMNEE